MRGTLFAMQKFNIIFHRFNNNVSEIIEIIEELNFRDLNAIKKKEEEKRKKSLRRRVSQLFFASVPIVDDA